MPEILKGYELKDACNADEGGLYQHALPHKLLPVSKGRCKGRKYAKKRIKVLLIDNVLDEKEPPIITEYSAKLRYSKTKRKKTTLWLIWLEQQKSLDGFISYGRQFKNLIQNHLLFLPRQNCLLTRKYNIQTVATRCRNNKDFPGILP